ncbi:MAG: SdrD B-like domain-containing protein, partial [Bacteroidota bacterium]
MKKKQYKYPPWSSWVLLVLLSCGLPSISYAQISLETSSGIQLEASGGIELEVSGNWQNQGSFSPDLSTLFLDGSGNQNLLNTSGHFYNVTIDKTSGEVFLAGDINFNAGTLSLITGNVELSGYLITLDATAMLSETAGNTVKGNSGYLTTTRTLSQLSNENVAGMGLALTTADDLGVTEIRRGHAVQSGNFTSSILRYFEVLANPAGAISADLVFYYDESELNGQTEADLQLYRSDDGGVNWTLVPGTLDTDNNSITATGQAQLTRFTLSAGCMENTTITQASCRDLSITLDDTGAAHISSPDINDGSTGACGLASLDIDLFTFDCQDIGANTVTLTVTGNDGSTSSCTSTVTVLGTTERLSPVLEGITFNPSTGQYEACFGYANDNSCTVSVAVGGDNRFTPGTDLGQPTEFLPGRQVNVFCVDLGPGETIVWTLTGPDGNTRTATATAPPTTLVAYVWDDQNGNGKQDNGEPAIEGAMVELVQNSDGTVLQTSISQADGTTTFADLGSYDGSQVKLRFYEKADHRFTLKDQGNNDNIDSDANRANGFTSVFTLDTDAVTTKWDCGLWSPGTVEAYAWDDQNGNGKQDNGEPPIEKVRVDLLESDDTFVATIYTDYEGIVRFSDVPADRPMKLQFYELGDHRFTLKDQGNNDNIDSDANRTNGKTATFQANRGGQVHTQMDAGLWSPGSAEAYVWDDQNGNGKQDNGEPAIAGVEVKLLEADGTTEIGSSTTDAAGIAVFTSVPADRSVMLQFFELENYRFTAKDQGNNDNIDSDANRTNGKTAT